MATTNETTAEHATEEADLRFARPQLIGTFGSEDAQQALLRLPSGEVQRLAVGDETRVGKVLAIEPGAIHVARAGRTRVLRLPGS